VVAIAGFGIVFGLSLVSVAYGQKIVEQTCERLALGFTRVSDGTHIWWFSERGEKVNMVTTPGQERHPARNLEFAPNWRGVHAWAAQSP
jgi:hypothetical protein